MAKANLGKLLEQINALTDEEKHQLRDVLVTWAQAQSPPTEEDFERSLLARGMLSAVRPLTDRTAWADRHPVPAGPHSLSLLLTREER